MLITSIEELDAIRVECKTMVTKRAGLSATAAVIPIPGVDFGADVALLRDIVHKVNQKFGLSHEQIELLEPQLKGVILISITSVGSSLLGKMITKNIVSLLVKRAGARVAIKGIVKFVPFLGQAAAASISFGVMKKVGNAHINDCYDIAKQAVLTQSA